MSYYTRVLSKDEEFPPFDELAQLIRAQHPEFKLAMEEGSEEEWETLLLSGNDDVEVALIERNAVTEGSMGQDEIAEFMEDLQECKRGRRHRNVEWYRRRRGLRGRFRHLSS